MGQDIAGYQIRIQDRICIHPQYCGRIMDPALTHNCNSYWCPSGTKPGYAHVLLLWKDLLALHPETSVTMTIVHNRVEYKIREMSIIKSQKISHGPLRNDSVHRVTLADKRYWINDKQLPTYVLANIYSPGGQRSPYLINSTFKGVTPGPFNPGDPPPSTTPKTWGNLVKELWPGAWGPPPTFTEPPFPPENIVLVGMNWAETFACILQMMGQRLIYIPFSNTFRFRPVGNESTVLPFNTPILDHSPLDKFQNINPSVIRVWFATKLEHYGTERDAHLVDNWLTDDATTFIDRFPGNLGFTIGKSPTSLNANMLAIMDKERNYVNEAELQEMATFHATNYLTDLNIHNYHRRFSGMKQLFPDGQIKAVRYGKTHKFLFTEIIRHPGEPTLDENGDMVYPKDYNPIASLHLPQRTIPEYPRVSQIVKMDDPETESDHIRFPLESVEGGADKRLHPAKLRHFPDADTDPRGGDLAEPDPWNAVTPYEVGDHVINDEKVYKNVNAGTGGDPPEHTSGTVDNWLFVATEDDYERMKLDRSYEEDVWVHLINSRGFAEGNHPTVRGQHLVVRRDGNATVTTEVEDFDPEDFNPEDFDTETEDETRPLYVADHPELMVEVLIPQGEDIAEGAQGPALFGPTESQDIQLHNILHEVHIQPTEKFFARWWPEKEKFVPVGDMDKDAIVKITGSELSNGMYPGAVQKYINGEWTTLYECLVLDLNS